MKYFISLFSFLLLSCSSIAQDEISFSGKFEQGHIVYGKTAPNAKVFLNEKELNVTKDGQFVFGFAREYDAPATIKAIFDNKKTKEKTFTVAKRDWEIQHIKGLKKKYVSPDPKIQKRIQKENALIIKARKQKTFQPYYLTGFISPIDLNPDKGILISGVFGSQRILNGIPKSPHAGVDIAAPTGTPVKAISDGVVSLVHQDMFYTGKTIMIDHGFGLQSIYVHLSGIDIQKGDLVHQGQIIGKVGATGRATGPHLHWGMTWNGIKLDPQTLLTTSQFH